MSTNEGQVVNDAPEYDPAGASLPNVMDPHDWEIKPYHNDHFAEKMAFVVVVLAPLAIIAGCCLLNVLLSIWLCDGCRFCFCLGGLW